MIREMTRSAVVQGSTGLPEAEVRREARRTRYVGVVREKSRTDCAREMNRTLNMKKSTGEILLRRTSQR